MPGQAERREGSGWGGGRSEVWSHGPWKGTIPKGTVRFQSSFFKGYRNFWGCGGHLSSWTVDALLNVIWLNVFYLENNYCSCSTVTCMFSVSIFRDLGELSRKLTPNTGSLVCAGMAHKWLNIFRFGAMCSPNDFHVQLRRSFVSGRPRCGLHIADPYVLHQTYLGMVRDSYTQILGVSVPHWNYRKYVIVLFCIHWQ